MNWLAIAAKIPRRNAVLVGLMIFHLAGLNRRRDGLTLTVKRCEVFGLGRKSVQRGLLDLEKMGLVSVERSPGRAARVDIITTGPTMSTHKSSTTN